jgi:hypothetical protein
MIKIRDMEMLFQPLRTRMDGDLNLHFLEQYIMVGRDNTPLEQVSNVTLNDPQVFGNAYLSIMEADERTLDVTHTDPSYQRQIESAFNMWLSENDERLSLQMIEPLDFCLSFFAGFRGWIGALPLMYKDGNKFQPTILPIDTRWMLWENGSRGLKWASYRIRMDKAQAEASYKKKIDTRDKFVEIECIWEADTYTVMLVNSGEGEKLASVTHGMGFCPVVIVPTPTLPMLINSGVAASDSLRSQGESIFAPVRDLIPKMNEIATVWATINRQQFQSPMVYHGSRDLKAQDIYGFGVVVQLTDTDEKIEPMLMRDMSPSAQALFMQLFARWERATLSSVNYGQAGDRQSALAIADLKSDRDKVILPRRKAKSRAYQNILKMLSRQVRDDKCYNTDIDDSIEIDAELFRQKFSVKVSFESISPQENVANTQLAIQQVRDLGLPRNFVYRNTLRAGDPEGLIREGKTERIYQLYPELESLDVALQLADGEITEQEINRLKAKIIVKRTAEMLQQQQTPEIPNPASQPKVDFGPAGVQKLSAMQQERAGQAALQEAQR